jgi:hypothetical protein
MSPAAIRVARRNAISGSRYEPVRSKPAPMMRGPSAPASAKAVNAELYSFAKLSSPKYRLVR